MKREISLLQTCTAVWRESIGNYVKGIEEEDTSGEYEVHREINLADHQRIKQKRDLNRTKSGRLTGILYFTVVSYTQNVSLLLYTGHSLTCSSF